MCCPLLVHERNSRVLVRPTESDQIHGQNQQVLVDLTAGSEPGAVLKDRDGGETFRTFY